MSSKKLSQLCIVCFVVFLFCTQSVRSQLQRGFYRSSCKMAEFIVKSAVRDGFIKDRGVAAGLVRMHFHDCFVRGCDGSVLLDSTPSNTAEKDSPANNPSLRGFEVIDNAKARLETVCKGIVSCADILAFAARDSIEITGGFGYDVPAGRRDGRVSLASETLTNLPPPTFNVAQLTQNFANKGFSQEEMVTLSGGHTIGRSHCTSFSNRLYNFSATMSQDPTLDASYATRLKQMCPQGSTDPNLVVPMDPGSPATTDAGYYLDILANRGLFTSDHTLLTNAATATQVNTNARNPVLWKIKFAAAMLKMSQLDVLTGLIIVQSQLRVGFYRNSCRRAESIVRDAVRDGINRNRGVAAGLVRMHFHDCFVRGCDGSVLLDSTPSNTAEKESPANNPSLRGFEVVDDAKARLEAECQGVVSCADILAFAARDSFDLKRWQSFASLGDYELTSPFFNVDQLTQTFAAKGLSQEEMVTLSGAHTIGRSHCTSFSDRLYNFNGTNSQDPSLDATYAASLRQSCPRDSTDPNLVVPMDPRTPTINDVNYYRDIIANRGLFTSDQTLLTNPATAREVNSNSRSPVGWRRKFAAAMVKMGQLDVLTGNAGEIRANCRMCARDPMLWRAKFVPAMVKMGEIGVLTGVAEGIRSNCRFSVALQVEALCSWKPTTTTLEGEGEVEAEAFTVTLLPRSWPFITSIFDTTVGFYSNSCRRAESIVRDAVRDGINQNSGVAAGLMGGIGILTDGADRIVAKVINGQGSGEF
ncbi:unnamed protein product [Dovyalis caffra]|uniref:peroxidase n=1 Tax=Dovyalis caffra TaxID=77055 RepID=A0AAV1QWB6_9ROSI|nr:unnamed protein product [Dovyalis caffra]